MASPSRSLGLPHGASFAPSDAELVTVYLNRKISGSPLPSPTARYIHDADVYAAEPAALVAGLLDASPKNGREISAWYFFTSVRAKSGRDTRRCRAVAGGAGTWHSEKARLEVLDGDQVVGYRQFFTFEPRNGWLMLEFTALDHREDGGGHRGEAVRVLCKIYQTRRSVSKKRKGERSGEGCSARVRRCLNFRSPPAAPNQVAVVPSEQQAEDPKEPQKQPFFIPIEQEAEDPKEPIKQPFFIPIDQEAKESKEPHKQPFFVPIEQAEELQYSEFAGASLIPTFPVTSSYGTTLLHPGQDWAISEIPQGTNASASQGNTAGLSCYGATATSLPIYRTGIWSCPTSTLSSSGNTLLYPHHDMSSMGNATSTLGCYDASSMYPWCSETYASRAPMGTRAEWANNGSNTNPLSYLCI